MIEQHPSIRQALEKKLLEAPIYTNNVGQAYYKVTPATLYSVLEALYGSDSSEQCNTDSTLAKMTEHWSEDLRKRTYFKEFAHRSATNHLHIQAMKAYEKNI